MGIMIWPEPPFFTVPPRQVPGIEVSRVNAFVASSVTQGPHMQDAAGKVDRPQHPPPLATPEAHATTQADDSDIS